MKTAILAAGAALALPVAAAAQDMDDMDSDDYDGTELVDSSVNVRTSDGITEEIRFEEDGVARVRGWNGLEREANYTVENDQLCLDEDDDALDRCYTYSGFDEGRTYRITDTNGVVSDVTMNTASRDSDRRYMSASYGERG